MSTNVRIIDSAINMDIHESLIPALRTINFASRYAELCKKHSDFKNSMNEYDKSFIQDFFLKKGIDILLVKRENFYRLIENVGELTIQFNVIPKSGFLQFVWDVKKGEE